MKSFRPGCLALLASLMQLAITVDLGALDPGLLQQLVLAPVFPCSLSQRCLQPGIEPARPDAQATTHRIPERIRARHCARSNGAHGLPLSGCHISRQHVPVQSPDLGHPSPITRRQLRELALPGIEGARRRVASKPPSLEPHSRQFRRVAGRRHGADFAGTPVSWLALQIPRQRTMPHYKRHTHSDDLLPGHEARAPMGGH